MVQIKELNIQMDPHKREVLLPSGKSVYLTESEYDAVVAYIAGATDSKTLAKMMSTLDIIRRIEKSKDPVATYNTLYDLKYKKKAPDRIDPDTAMPSLSKARHKIGREILPDIRVSPIRPFLKKASSSLHVLQKIKKK